MGNFINVQSPLHYPDLYLRGVVIGFVCALCACLIVAFIVWCVYCKQTVYNYNENKRGFKGHLLNLDSWPESGRVFGYLLEIEKRKERKGLHIEDATLNAWREIDPKSRAMSKFYHQLEWRMRKLGLTAYIYKTEENDATSDEEKEELEKLIRNTEFPPKDKWGKMPELFSLVLFLLSSASLLALAAFFIILYYSSIDCQTKFDTRKEWAEPRVGIAFGEQ